MSVIGTGAAAGVAQSGLQAQQLARQRDRQRAQASADAGELRVLFVAQLDGLDDGEAESSHLHMDDQLPDHQAPGRETNPSEPPAQPADSTPVDPEADETSPPHLDVRA